MICLAVTTVMQLEYRKEAVSKLGQTYRVRSCHAYDLLLFRLCLENTTEGCNLRHFETRFTPDFFVPPVASHKLAAVLFR